MRDGCFCIRELRRGVRVAVERKHTPGAKRPGRQRVIEVLSRGIAIDFDRDASLRRRCEHGVPVGDHAGTRAGDPAARVGQDADGRVRDRRQHPAGLILVLSQPRMRRGQDHVEGGRLVVVEIQLTRGIDVGFNALQQPEPVAELALTSETALRCRPASAMDIPPAIFSPYEWSVTAA